jgi:hypothetical protein
MLSVLGEIDIIEGVNSQSTNLMSLHVSVTSLPYLTLSNACQRRRV